MPIISRTQNGKKQYRWGSHGTWYDTREGAEKQSEAAYANGYAGDAAKILEPKKDKNGLFVQSQDEGAEREQIEQHNRDRFASHFHYADPYTGNTRTYDPTGNYRCGDCNQEQNRKCDLVQIKLVDRGAGSCDHWEDIFDGDFEIPLHLIPFPQAGYAIAANGVGFGCRRCPFASNAHAPDSQGRTLYCGKGDMRVYPTACCGLNGAEELQLNDQGLPEKDMVFDASARSYDANGWLRINRSHISKATVNPYYGREIPGCEQLGLQPDKIYQMLRDPEELRKAVDTFKGIPVLSKHTPIATFDTLDEQEKKKYIVGAVGSEVEFNEPYLDADTTIWDASAIAGIETDIQREHSCSYRYVPIMTTGNYNGQPYDGIMTQIQGNHLALVESGRAGPDVLAADSKLEREPMKRTKLGNALIVALETAFPKVKFAQDSALEKALANVTSKSFGAPERDAATKLILAADAEVDGKKAKAVMDALSNIDEPEPKKNEEPEAAEDDEEEEEEEEKKTKKASDKKATDQSKEDKAMWAQMKKDGMADSQNDSAMDTAIKNLRNQYLAADEAKRAVRPVVGDVIAMDSAADIYGFALDQMKIDRTGVEGVPALRALFGLAKERQTAAPVAVAMDAAVSIKRFSNLGRIRQA